MDRSNNRKNKLLGVAAAFMLSAPMALVVGCGGGEAAEPAPELGAEVGTYYCVVGSDEYRVYLKDINQATVLEADATKYGTYSVDGEGNIKISLLDGTELVGKYEDDVLTLGDRQYLRRVFYTVTFDSKGGASVAPQQVLNGQTASKPADPDYGGYVFLGWYSDEAYTKPYVFSAEGVTGNVTLYAQWAQKSVGQNECSVKLDTDGAGTFAAQTTIGNKLYNMPTPSKEGYTFKGWYISQTEDKNKLTQKWTADVEITENTTLFAVWESNDTTALKSPVVSVSDNAVVWDKVDGATGYTVRITAPDKTVKEANVGTEKYEYVFDKKGEYEIEVFATRGSEKSAAQKRYFGCKTLKRVSKFEVIEPSILRYDGVPHAEKYIIKIECGNASHNHDAFDNGNSTYLSFVNCEMTENGISFTVTAEAEDYASSVSVKYTYKRELDEIKNISYDEDSDTLKWERVPNALAYEVKVNDKTATVYDNAFSLKKEGKGKLNVSVKPVTKGFISKSTEASVNKTRIASPDGFEVDGTVLKWTAVKDAVKYTVKVGDKEHTAASNSFDLVGKYNGEAVYVKAEAADGASGSLYGDRVQITSALGGVKYSGGKVMWQSVLGASWYTVKVNDGAAVRIDKNKNSAPIVLTKRGYNTVTVSDGTTERSVDVYAYAVRFNGNGSNYKEQVKYLAKGDEISSPESLPELGGSEFNGWYTSSGGSTGNGKRVYDGDVFDGMGDLTLYASWIYATYKVDLVCGDGSFSQGSSAIGSVKFNSEFSLAKPTPPDPSYIFVGWFSEPTAGIRYTDENGNGIDVWKNLYGGKAYAHYAKAFDFTYLENSKTYSVVQNTLLRTADVKEITVPKEYDDGIHGLKTVSIIDGYAFNYCNKLEKISFYDTVSVVEVDSGAFDACTLLKEINVIHVAGNNDPVYSSDNGALIMNNVMGERQLKFVPRGISGVFAIPADVTAIPAYALSDCNIVDLSIPQSVKNIYSRAFNSCRELKKVRFDYGANTPDNALVIYERAFYNCYKLNDVDFPARLKGFDSAIFEYSTAVKNISIERNDTYAVINDILVNTKTSEAVYFPVGRDKCEITSAAIQAIGSGAFYKAYKLEEISIPAWISKIGERAFAECSSLSSVIFTDRDASSQNLVIGESAFEKCSALKTVTFGANVKLTDIERKAFSYCAALKSVTVPVSVTAIGGGAFEGCSGMVSVELGNGVKTIGESAFAKCSSLSEIVIPSQVTSIGAGVFEGCAALKSVSFASGGTALEIADNAFKDCTALTAFAIPAHATSISGGFLSGCYNLSRVTVDPSNTNYLSADDIVYACDKGVPTAILFCPTFKFGSYTLPDSLKTIGSGIFKGNPNITKVVIPNGVNEIGEGAFEGCTSLREVEFLDGSNTQELKIGKNAFKGCSKLPLISLPDRVKTIKEGTFANCVSLIKIEISSYVEEIESATSSYNGAFYNCTAASSLTFKTRKVNNVDTLNITKIGAYAFNGCSSLTSVTVPAKVEKIGQCAFNGCSSVTSFSIEGGETPLYVENTSYGGTFAFPALKTLTVPERLMRLSDGIFNGCSSITEFTLTSTLQNVADREETSYNGMAIGKNAFSYCSSLVTVKIAENSTNTAAFSIGDGAFSIGDGAFSNCAALMTVNLPKRLSPVTVTEGGNEQENISNLIKADSNPTAVVGNLFMGCKAISSINVEDGCKYYESRDGVLYSKGAKTLLICPPEKTGTVIVPATTETIGFTSFYYSKVTELKFQEDVENYTAEQKKALEPLVISGKYKEGWYTSMGAFANAALSTVSFPARLAEIGDFAFETCKQLSSVTFASDGKLAKIGESAFGSVGSWSSNALPLITSLAFPVAYEGNKLESSATDVRIFNVPNLATISVNKKLLSRLDAIGCGDAGSVKVYDANGVAQENRIMIDGTTLLRYSATNTDETYEVPANITAIAAGAFKGNTHLKHITFETGSKISSIGANAFDSCTSLQSITFPDDCAITTIPSYAFRNCASLKTIEIPKLVNSIGNNAFEGCSSLGAGVQANDQTGVKEGEGVTFRANTGGVHSIQTIGVEAFKNCTSLKLFTVPGSVTTVGDGATYGGKSGTFNGCTALEKVIFKTAETEGSTLTLNAYYNYLPFANCKNLTEVDLGGRKLALETTLFSGCASLTTVKGMENVTEFKGDSYNGKQFEKTGITSITIPANVTELPCGAFLDCANLKTVNGLDHVTEMGDCVFQNCASLESLGLSTQLTHLPMHAFDGCVKLEHIDLSKITSYESYAFKNCKKLTTAHLPASLAVIPEESWFGSGIVNLVIPATVTEIESCAFAGCADLVSVSFEKSDTELVLSEPWYAYGAVGQFADCVKLSSVDFNGRKTKIGMEAFMGCSALKTLDLDGVTTIGLNSFADCGNADFTSITIPTSVTLISGGAFRNCASLESITFANDASAGALTIADGGVYVNYEDVPFIFEGCAALGSVDFGGRKVSIGKNAFKDVASLTTVQGLDGVISYGDSAFENTGISSLTLAGDNAVFGNRVFAGNNGLTKVAIDSDGFETVGANAFIDCGELTEIEFTGGGKTLGGIAASAFENCAKLQTVVFPSYIKSFGERAFYNCGLRSLDILGGVTDIASYAFGANKELTTLSVAAEIASLGVYSFAECVKLDTVSFAEENPLLSEIGDGVFYGCSSLASIDIPASVRRIGESAFEGTALASVALPSGVTSLGFGAFMNISALNSVSLPATLTNIEGNPFGGCVNIETFTVDPLNASYKVEGTVIYNGDKATLVACLAHTSSAVGDIPETVQTILPSAFLGAKLTSVIIPEGVVEIAADTFNGCADLVSVTLPSSAVGIGANAFAGCKSLASIDLKNVRNIGENAFADCVGLTSVVMPNVVMIGRSAFSGCATLNNVEIPAGVAELSDNMFEDCAAMTTLTFAQNSKLAVIGANVFKNSGLTAITVPNGVLNFDNSQFADAKALTSVTFAQGDMPVIVGGSDALRPFGGCENLSTFDFNGRRLIMRIYAFAGCGVSSFDFAGSLSIPEGAFMDCAKLTSVVIPDSVSSVGSYAFKNSGVKTLTISRVGNKTLGNDCFANTKVETLSLGGNLALSGYGGMGVFGGCAALESVSFDEGCIAVPDYMFKGCENLTNVSIPSTVTVLGNSSFEGCVNLASVTLPAGLKEMRAETFRNCTSLTSITLPEGFTGTLHSAFRNSGLTSITFPESMTSISTNVFDGCSGLIEIVIPASITSIGQEAFKDCVNLERVTFNSTKVTSLKGVFAGCTKIKTLVIPSKITEMGGINPYNAEENTSPFKGWGKDQTIYFTANTQEDSAEWLSGWSGGANVVFGEPPQENA